MCSVAPDVFLKLEATVRQFLDEGRMFTGYDVTIETRTREKIKLRHEEARSAIHEIQVLADAVEFGYDPPGGQTTPWQKSQVSMPSGQWAFVYHPAGVDPNGYQPRNGAAPTVSVTTVAVTAAAPALPAPASDGSVVSDSGGQNGDGTFSTDYRDRLLVPTRFLRELGLGAGHDCYVVVDTQNNRIRLVSDSTNHLSDPNNRISAQRVERQGDIRLSSRTLRLTGDASKFTVETSDLNGEKVVNITPA